jgi:AcrR family transcriptional regulator
MKTAIDPADRIREAYQEYLLDQGHAPASVYAFAKKLKLSEAEFYQFYNSFEQVEADLWLQFFNETRRKVEAEEVYPTYSVREKLLAFYFTWIEVLKTNRSFVLLSFGKIRAQGLRRPSPILQPFRKAYQNYVADLLAEGRESREVQSRRFVEDRYPDGFWVQALWLLDFWTKDTSRNFEKTDSAIEKAVNTSFDLIGTSALDSVLDLAKFVYQNRATS